MEDCDVFRLIHTPRASMFGVYLKIISTTVNHHRGLVAGYIVAQKYVNAIGCNAKVDDLPLTRNRNGDIVPRVRHGSDTRNSIYESTGESLPRLRRRRLGRGRGSHLDEN